MIWFVACGTLFSPWRTLLSIFSMLFAKENTINFCLPLSACADFFCLFALRCLDLEGRVDTALTSC